MDKIKDGREGDDAAKEAGGDLLGRTVSMGGQLGMDLEGIDFLGTEAGSTRKVPTVFFFFSAQRSGMGKRERESATRIFVVVGDDCAC